MIFAGIDVDIITHEKALASGMEAFGLWCWGMCYAQKHTTNGRLPRVSVLAAMRVSTKTALRLASKLVETGLWLASDDGSWSIWNYARKNQTAEEIEIRKSLAVERTRRWRERLRRSPRDAVGDAPVTPVYAGHERARMDPPPETQLQLQPETDLKISTATPPASPTRARGERGTRLSEDWTPSDDTRAWACSKGMDPEKVLSDFRNYWLALPGPRARKLDWDRTFRSRVQDLADRKAPTGRGGGPRGDRQPLGPKDASWLKTGGEL